MLTLLIFKGFFLKTWYISSLETSVVEDILSCFYYIHVCTMLILILLNIHGVSCYGDGMTYFGNVCW